ncbi:hypothetical protein X975_25279, partial [Stegodyphus mimosarum]
MNEAGEKELALFQAIRPRHRSSLFVEVLGYLWPV